MGFFLFSITPLWFYQTHPTSSTCKLQKKASVKSVIIKFCNNSLSFDLKADAVARFSQDSEAYATLDANVSSGNTKAYNIGYRGLLAEAVISMQQNSISYTFINS